MLNLNVTIYAFYVSWCIFTRNAKKFLNILLDYVEYEFAFTYDFYSHSRVFLDSKKIVSKHKSKIPEKKIRAQIVYLCQY